MAGHGRHARRRSAPAVVRSALGATLLVALAGSAVAQAVSLAAPRRQVSALTPVADTQHVVVPPAIPLDDWGGALVQQAPIGGVVLAAPAAARQVGSPGSIPTLTLGIYQRTSEATRASNPSCHLAWPLLAAIGLIESNHGRHTELLNGRQVVLGPVLDGHGFAAVPDTDHGRLDGNTQWDRAVGPMQFLPSTWATYGRDANADGTADPQDGADATAAAAAYLCAAGGNLSQPAGLARAVMAYNHSSAYVQHVLIYMIGYSQDNPALAALGRAALPL